MTDEELPWLLAEKFGWTLEYVDALTMDKLHQYLQIQDGIAHANNSILKK